MTKVLGEKLNIILIFIGLFLLNACTTYNSSYYFSQKPSNFNPKLGKWIINTPELDPKLDHSFKTKTPQLYKDLLQGKIGQQLTSIYDFDGVFLPRKDRSKQSLSILFEQTKYDFLIDTTITMIKDNSSSIVLAPDSNNGKEITLIITIYDLKQGNLLLEKTHFYGETYEGKHEVSFFSKMNKLISHAINESARDLKRKGNWN